MPFLAFVSTMCYIVGNVTKEMKTMSKGATATVHARVSPTLKKRAEGILARVGLNPSDAVRLLYSQVVEVQGLPFPVRIPNAETRKALAEARSGKLKGFDSVEELFADLKG